LLLRLIYFNNLFFSRRVGFTL